MPSLKLEVPTLVKLKKNALKKCFEPTVYVPFQGNKDLLLCPVIK